MASPRRVVWVVEDQDGLPWSAHFTKAKAAMYRRNGGFKSDRVVRYEPARAKRRGKGVVDR